MNCRPPAYACGSNPCNQAGGHAGSQVSGTRPTHPIIKSRQVRWAVATALQFGQICRCQGSHSQAGRRAKQLLVAAAHLQINLHGRQISSERLHGACKYAIQSVHLEAPQLLITRAHPAAGWHCHAPVRGRRGLACCKARHDQQRRCRLGPPGSRQHTAPHLEPALPPLHTAMPFPRLWCAT